MIGVQETNLNDYLQQEPVFRCPKCGKEIPEHLQGCWQCGYVLNRRLVKLKKEQHK